MTHTPDRSAFHEGLRLGGLPQRTAGQWLCFAAIALVVVAIYAPSLGHFGRGDHIGYLAEVASRHSLRDLTLGSFDLNRTRHFNSGDTLLFRPVLYMLLGAETYFFKYNFVLWQAVGIAAHLGVLLTMFRLFLALDAGWPAVWCTAFFGVLFVNLEMVTWQHVTAYMLFVMFSLVALRRLYLILIEDDRGRRHYAALWGVLLISVFTHEMAVIMTAIMAVTLFVLRPAHRPFALLMAAIPVLYLAVDIWDMQRCHMALSGQMPPVNTGPGFWVECLGGMFTWLYVGLVPFNFGWVFAARTTLKVDPQAFIGNPGFFSVFSAYAVGLVLVGLLLPARSIRTLAPARRTVALLGIACAGVFGAMVFIGRGADRSIGEVVWLNAHYFYIFWAFILVAFYAAVDWRKAGGTLKRAFLVFAAVLMIVNALRVQFCNEQRAVENRKYIVLTRAIQDLIRQKAGEPGFSFYVPPDYPGNFLCTNVYRRGDPEGRQYALMEVLFPRYFTAVNPKYVFTPERRE